MKVFVLIHGCIDLPGEDSVEGVFETREGALKTAMRTASRLAKEMGGADEGYSVDQDGDGVYILRNEDNVDWWLIKPTTIRK